MKVKQKTLRFGQYSGLPQEKQKSLKMIQCNVARMRNIAHAWSLDGAVTCPSSLVVLVSTLEYPLQRLCFRACMDVPAPHHVDQGWGPGQGMQTWCTSFQRGNPHPNLDGPLQQRRWSRYSRVLASFTKLDGQVTAPSRLHACAMLRMRATLHCIIFKLFCFSWGRPEYWPKRRVFCFTFDHVDFEITIKYIKDSTKELLLSCTW